MRHLKFHSKVEKITYTAFKSTENFQGSKVYSYRARACTLDPRQKTEYANKVKCSTLKSGHPSPNGGKENQKLMLGLTAGENSHCEYEPKRIVSGKSKKRRQYESPNIDNPFNLCKIEPKTLKEIPGNVPLFNESLVNSPSIDLKNEDPLPLFNDPDPIQDNTKDFMSSFGSWFNDLFNAAPSSKRPHTAPKVEQKPLTPKVIIEEDSDYFKSINVLKEQFKKKLKSETSVHVLNGDKLQQFHFDKETQKKVKKRSRSLPPLTESFVEELFTTDAEPPKTGKSGGQIRRQDANNLTHFFFDHRDKEISPQLYSPKNTLILNDPNLIREKKKHKGKDRSVGGTLEEYVFPVPADLTKRLLLNLDDQEKASRLYKHSHIGMQENSHVQRKSKSYQHNARCYTTNASASESLRANRNLHMISSGKRKVLGEFARDNSTFVKIRSHKPSSSPQLETTRIDTKGSSDDLVKYLMKKVKVQHRPQHPKKKNSITFNVPTLTSGKGKFMQSATSSLVMNALSKKENDILLPTRNSIRMPGEKNDLLSTKSAHHSKTWNAKYDEAQARLDVKRVSTQNRLNKSTYLSDDLESNYLLDRNYRYGRRFIDSSFKSDVKDLGDKHSRRPETKTSATKLDKSNIYKMAKIKPKDPKKKLNLFENFDALEGRENTSGKFQHQHELFKNSLKAQQSSGLESEPETNNSSANNYTGQTEPILDSNSTHLSTELAIVDNFQLIPTDSDVIKCDANTSVNPSLQSDGREATDKVFGCFNIDDNSLNLSVDQNQQLSHWEKDHKIEQEDMSVKVLSQFGVLEAPLSCPQDVRQSKSLETGLSLLSRRLPTNDMSKQNKSLKTNHGGLSSMLSEKDNCKESGESGKKQTKEKQKENLKKSTIGGSPDCGFEKSKKPGPSCEEGIVTS